MAGKVKYFYSREARPGFEDHTFVNARFFSGVPADAGSAVVNGDYEDIFAAFQAANLPVKRLDPGNPKAKPEPAPIQPQEN